VSFIGFLRGDADVTLRLRAGALKLTPSTSERKRDKKAVNLLRSLNHKFSEKKEDKSSNFSPPMSKRKKYRGALLGREKYTRR
jgi:hypothetical protein